MTAKSNQTPKIEAYLDALDDDKRAALQHIRQIVAKAAPDAEEALVYGVPGFRIGGKALVCYAAFKNHCGFYPMSPALMDKMQDQIDQWRSAKGTLQFSAHEGLPDKLVKDIVSARLLEMAQCA